jgi:hypothetical protein
MSYVVCRMECAYLTYIYLGTVGAELYRQYVAIDVLDAVEA